MALTKPMTRRGFERLAQEHEQLFKVERPKVVDGVATAAAEGDRSENAEYIYGKKRLREIDKRLRYLSELLKDVQIVDPEKLQSATVVFGATVELVDENDGKHTYMIVGNGETATGQISWKSPMAIALMGKKVGDTVTVHRPAGDMEFEITKIRFGYPS
jgi:transcription elongation factor GreB